MGKKKFYVVWHGVSPGIYTSWTDCKLQINGFEGAIYKSFDTQEEAERAYNTSPYLYIQKKKTTAPAVSGNTPTDVPSYRHDTVLPLPPEVPAEALAVDAAMQWQPGCRWNTEAFISVRAKPSSISDRCMAPIISVNFWPLYMP